MTGERPGLLGPLFGHAEAARLLGDRARLQGMLDFEAALARAEAAVGVIPAGHYYVYAPHKDSLDSRYALVGWISEEEIIGRTFSLF